MKDFWNDRYAETAYAYGTEPNAFLAEIMTALQPGTCLFPCEGEGRNAVFAATKEWKVDAFDQSEKGLEKCLALANQYGVEVNYQLADAVDFDYGAEKYDMIALVFAHFNPETRQTVHQKCFDALKPGGVIIIEAFNPKQLEFSSGGPKEEANLYTEAMLKNDFQHAGHITFATTTCRLNEGKYHEGFAAVIRALIVKRI
jgi:SAM-dependent methyltransferase